MGEVLFACGVIRVRQNRFITRSDVVRLGGESGWDECHQILDRAGLIPDREGEWRTAPRKWAARCFSSEAHEVADLLPGDLSAFPWIGVEAHNLGWHLTEVLEKTTPAGGPLPGGRIGPREVSEGVFPPPWDRETDFWIRLREGEEKSPFGIKSACRLAAARYRASLLENEGRPLLKKLARILQGSVLMAILLRSRLGGRPWIEIRSVLDREQDLGMGDMEMIYPLPAREWSSWLDEPWAPLVEGFLENRDSSSWEVMVFDRLVPLLAEALAEPLTVEPVIAYLLAREMQIKAVGMALEAKTVSLKEEFVDQGLPRFFL